MQITRKFASDADGGSRKVTFRYTSKGSLQRPETLI